MRMTKPRLLAPYFIAQSLILLRVKKIHWHPVYGAELERRAQTRKCLPSFEFRKQ